MRRAIITAWLVLTLLAGLLAWPHGASGDGPYPVKTLGPKLPYPVVTHAEPVSAQPGVWEYSRAEQADREWLASMPSSLPATGN